MIRLIFTISIIVFLLSCGPTSEISTDDSSLKEYKWKMVTAWPPNSPINQESVEKFAENVRIMSRDRLKIQVFAGGELVPPLQA